jgi:hypothetical protein
MSRIDWGKWSAIAQVVSSVAVLVTLLYLAIETRQNTAAILSSSRQQSLNAEFQVLRMIYDDPMTSFSQPLQPGLEGLKQRAVDFSLFRLREHQWLQYQDGLLDRDTMTSYLTILVGNIQTEERVGQHWNAVSAGFAPGFVAEVNRILAEGRGFESVDLNSDPR